jgi:hypothetical protein
MRLRDKIISVVCVILAAFLIIAAGMQLDYINSQRQEMKLTSNEPLKNAPPSLAFATVAMGAFRGLVVDVLWLRADKLKEQGQFFDAKQLAEWITTLRLGISGMEYGLQYLCCNTALSARTKVAVGQKRLRIAP